VSLIRVIQGALGKRTYGYKKDLADARDSWLSARLGAPLRLPPSASVRDSRVSPKDQSSTSSCTGQSTSQALRLAYLKEGIACPDLSALFPYYLGRSIEGAEGSDGGAYIRDVIKAIMKWGEAAESAWPFNLSAVNKHPNVKAYRSAYDRRGAKKYHRIPSGDANGIRQALAAGYPVVAGWQVSQSFEDYDGTGVIPAQEAPFLGGHAICLTGYSADGTFELLNSWGTGWGKGGYAIVSEAFVQQATDVWALEVV